MLSPEDEITITIKKIVSRFRQCRIANADLIKLITHHVSCMFVFYICIQFAESITLMLSPIIYTTGKTNICTKQQNNKTNQKTDEGRHSIFWMHVWVTSSPSQLLDAATQASLYLPMTTFSQVLVFS